MRTTIIPKLNNLIQTFRMIKKRLILKDKLISNPYLTINMKIKKKEIKCMNIMNN